MPITRAILACSLALASACGWAAEKPMNILFIAVDDLRPDIGCYGNTVVKTPHMDRIAAQGTVFNQAYCQQAVCSPSRTSLLTGLRPDSTKVYDLVTHFRTTVPEVVTLPQHFKDNGYQVEGYGKLFHMSLDDAKSWSTPWKHPKAQEYQDPANQALDAKGKAKEKEKSASKVGQKGPSYEFVPAEASGYKDGVITQDALTALPRLVSGDKPFFLAVGLTKPHLPFVAPKSAYDLYTTFSYPTVPSQPPKGMSALMGSDWGELRAYSDIPATGPIPEAQAAELRKAYYACITATDTQIGRLLDALETQGVADRTLIVLWGDHGFKLGEFGMWCKHTNLEIDTRVPLLLQVPGARGGQRSQALVEFVDIYPTLVEAAGLPAVAANEGTSLMPLVAQPDRPWKKAAFSQYPRQGTMGYSVKTADHRYTRWIDQKTGAVRTRELYRVVAGGLETENIADQPEAAAVVAEHDALLDGGWKAARP